MPLEKFNNISQNKILRYLILGVIVVSLAILIRETILKEQPLEIPEMQPITSGIEIDFKFLESPELKNLFKFEELSMPASYGRDNPFKAY